MYTSSHVDTWEVLNKQLKLLEIVNHELWKNQDAGLRMHKLLVGLGHKYEMTFLTNTLHIR